MRAFLHTTLKVLIHEQFRHYGCGGQLESDLKRVLCQHSCTVVEDSWNRMSNGSCVSIHLLCHHHPPPHSVITPPPPCSVIIIPLLCHHPLHALSSSSPMLCHHHPSCFVTISLLCHHHPLLCHHLPPPPPPPASGRQLEPSVTRILCQHSRTIQMALRVGFNLPVPYTACNIPNGELIPPAND